MKNTANIFNIQHFSLNDGPGIRTVVFFKGCPINCAWCHNPESKSAKKELSFLKDKCKNCKKCVQVCGKGVHTFSNGIHNIDRTKCINCNKCVEECPFSSLEIIGKSLTFEEIMEDIEKDDVFFGDDGGVTFSGGEPFMQFEALLELAKMCKEKGYCVCIETSGYTTKEKIEKISEYVDCFLFDIKETNKEIHQKYVGVDNEIILKNLEFLDKLKSKVVLRCPIISSVNDREEHFLKIAELSLEYNCIKSVEFMPYHPLGMEKSIQIGKKCEFENDSFMDKKKIEQYCKLIENMVNVPLKIN